MTKIYLSILSVLFSLSVLSQNSELNQGELIRLPQKASLALGIEVKPVLNYFGTLFNSDKTSLIDIYNNDIPLSISTKYFIRDKVALRAALGFRYVNGSSNDIVKEVQANDSLTLTSNKTNLTSYGIRLSGGVEFRKGLGRLQFFYGPQISIGYLQYTEQYEYDFNLSDIAGLETPAAAERISEFNPGATLNFELGAFVGTEYFLLSNFSICGEFGFSARYKLELEGEEIYDTYERTNFLIIPLEQLDEEARGVEGSTSINVQSIPTISISMNYYF